MKIAFLGDSITKAELGVSYISEIQKRFKTYQLDNYGKNGDTVISLFKRIKKMKELKEYDKIVLFIGINDVYGKMSFWYKLHKVLKRQKRAKNGDVFILAYRSLLDYLGSLDVDIIIVPPLLIGENVDNVWNQEVTNLETRIELLVKQYPALVYLDVHNKIHDYLHHKEVSDYIPKEILQVKKDFDTLKSTSSVDAVSKERGLHLTLDGVHLNSAGAHEVAKEIIKELEKE